MIAPRRASSAAANVAVGTPSRVGAPPAAGIASVAPGSSRPTPSSHGNAPIGAAGSVASGVSGPSNASAAKSCLPFQNT